MSNTFTFTYKNYSIVTSLNERTIYLKITDNISFYQYEGNVDCKELRINIELVDAYTIICNCFKGGVEGYSTVLTVTSGLLKIQFNALVGGFLKMNFEVMLREKVMSNDGQLTINFNRLEQKLNAGLQKLEQRCQELEDIIEEKNEEILHLADKLSYAHIFIGYQNTFKIDNSICLNVKELNCQCSNDGNSIKYEMIEKFYQLEKLQTNYFRAANFMSVKMKSNSLKELYINAQNEGTFTSLEGINEMPNLEKITIISGPALTNIPTILKSYKHNINYIKIQSCAQVNVVELQTYCQTNNIKLEIS
jgi:hypothetical protein